MAKRKTTVALSATDDKSLSLSQPLALAAGSVSVDRATGEIANVAIISRGPAVGHGFDVDDTMLRQVRDGLKSAGQMPMHLTHSHKEEGLFAPPPDPLLSIVGHVDGSTARIEDGRVRASVKLGKFAEHVPGQGNVRDFILGLAEESPSSIGLSIVFAPAEFEQRRDAKNQSLPPAGRVKQLKSVDFVGKPGANPNGLLSEPNTPHFSGVTMNKKLLAYLKTIGLADGATESEALAFFKALSLAEHKAEAERLSKLSVNELDDEPNPQPSPKEVDKPVTLSSADVELASRRAADEAVRLERARQSEIFGLAEKLNLDHSWALQMVNGGFSLAQAKDAALAKVAERKAPIQLGAPRDLNLTSIVPAIAHAILLRIGRKVENAHERAKEFVGLSLIDMARHHFAALGVPDAFSLSRVRVAQLLGPREFRNSYPGAVALAQSTSDFTSILADTINKSLRIAYLDAPKTWNIWARKTTNNDFKTITRAALSEAPTLTSRNESGEVDYVTLSDGKEQYTLAEYVGGIKLTRRAVINDDLDAFSRIPVLQAAAAARLEDDVAYGILTTNAAMADAVALFHATHNNLIAAGGAAPSVATIAATEKLLMKQKGPKSAARLELPAKFLLVPTSIYRVTQQAVTSTVDPAKNNAAMNPYANEGLIVVPSARLDDNSATAWYMVTDNNLCDTVEVCFLTDEQEPVLQQETDFDTDDVKFKVRHTVSAKAIDFRGMAKNPGA